MGQHLKAEGPSGRIAWWMPARKGRHETVEWGGIRGKKVRVIKFGVVRGRMGECVDEAFRENVRPFKICHGRKPNAVWVEA